MKRAHVWPSFIFSETSFTRKMSKSSDSMYSSIFMPEKIWCYNFRWCGSNFFQFSSSLFLPVFWARLLHFNVFFVKYYTAQKMKISIKDFFSICVTKSAVSCGFGHIYWRNPKLKTSFFIKYYTSWIYPKEVILYH